MDRKDQGGDSSVIRVIAEHCRQCGNPIEVTSPTWYRVHRDLRRMRLSYSYAPDESALCIGCCLASKSPEERPAWERHLHRLLQRKELARVPAGATFFHHRDENAHVFERTNAVHHTDLYFMISHQEARPEWKVPAESFWPRDGAPPRVHLYVAVDVRLEGVAAKVEVTWSAETLGLGPSAMQVVDWERSTHEDLIRLMEGTRFLYEGAGLWRGRPPGRTTLTREEFLDRYRQAREQCLLDGFPLTDNNLVRFLPISKATLIRYRNKWLPDSSITDT